MWMQFSLKNCIRLCFKTEKKEKSLHPFIHLAPAAQQSSVRCLNVVIVELVTQRAGFLLAVAHTEIKKNTTVPTFRIVIK